MAARIKKDDLVYIRSGDDRGKTGKVLEVMPDRERVVVEGVNLVWKHVRPNDKNRKGGRIQKPASLHMSKVQPVDPKTGRGTRIMFTTEGDTKRRVAVKTGSEIGIVRKTG